MIALYVIGSLTAVLMIWGLLTFNRLVRLKTLVKNSWSNIDTELVRRHELIPNLVEVVQGYAKHERELLTQLVESRTLAVNAGTARPLQRASTEQRFERNLNSLLMRVEAYPDLRASEQFSNLQQELSLTEDRIQVARRIYNANVAELNALVAQMPSSLIASWAKIGETDFFAADISNTSPPDTSSTR